MIRRASRPRPRRISRKKEAPRRVARNTMSKRGAISLTRSRRSRLSREKAKSRRRRETSSQESWTRVTADSWLQDSRHVRRAPLARNTRSVSPWPSPLRSSPLRLFSGDTDPLSPPFHFVDAFSEALFPPAKIARAAFAAARRGVTILSLRGTMIPIMALP